MSSFRRWLADRFSPRKLMTFSLLMTGFAGLYFASFPSYRMSIIVHGFWGIMTGLTFWASMIKATRDWALSSEQGRAFGILETVRGIAEMATSTVFLAIFALRGIYFALLEEGRVPLAITGTAAGIVSVVGFTPDIFRPMVGGVLLDRYPGAPGYRLLFLFIAGLCLLGFLSAMVILRKYARGKTPKLQNSA